MRHQSNTGCPARIRASLNSFAGLWSSPLKGTFFCALVCALLLSAATVRAERRSNEIFSLDLPEHWKMEMEGDSLSVWEPENGKSFSILVESYINPDLEDLRGQLARDTASRMLKLLPGYIYQDDIERGLSLLTPEGLLLSISLSAGFDELTPILKSLKAEAGAPAGLGQGLAQLSSPEALDWLNFTAPDLESPTPVEPWEAGQTSDLAKGRLRAVLPENWTVSGTDKDCTIASPTGADYVRFVLLPLPSDEYEDFITIVTEYAKSLEGVNIRSSEGALEFTIPGKEYAFITQEENRTALLRLYPVTNQDIMGIAASSHLAGEE
ncbi:hypothetical protein LJC59_06895 [Desulfovibrio sp. OttesenSCG-928-A18]|nr:hypothetical protein [Desulfovibrio sp. OttesenSCG-928-A18]